ncbi:hypothetical protein LQL77_06915 [Rhodococcus cerastii]|nr:hypothetical protein [Rhodococcus cerastii]
MSTVEHRAERTEDAPYAALNDGRVFDKEVIPRIEVSGKNVPGPCAEVRRGSALDRVVARHEESRELDISLDDPDPRFPSERESWADPDRDFVAIKQKDCMVMSVPLYTTLGRHNGIQFTGTDDRIRPAFVAADLRRRLSEAQPHIVLEKYAKVGTGQIMEMIKGSQVELEVSEAVRLAHDLLLLVDLATGASDDIGEVA